MPPLSFRSFLVRSSFILRYVNEGRIEINQAKRRFLERFKSQTKQNCQEFYFANPNPQIQHGETSTFFTDKIVFLTFIYYVII